MKTQAALAAKAIKEELKKQYPTVKFSVKSENYSMGDNVSVSWCDGPTCREVEKITDKYQYGSFNGMEDIYELTNCRNDIPQTKYLLTSRTPSQLIEEKIINWVKNYWTENILSEYGFINREVRKIFESKSFPEINLILE